MEVVLNCIRKPPVGLQGFACTVELGQAIDQMGAAKDDLAVIRGQIPCDVGQLLCQLEPSPGLFTMTKATFCTA